MQAHRSLVEVTSNYMQKGFQVPALTHEVITHKKNKTIQKRERKLKNTVPNTVFPKYF